MLQNILALHFQIKWTAKEKAMDIAGVSAFASLFGNSYSPKAATVDSETDNAESSDGALTAQGAGALPNDDVSQ
jgi:hypothetical protein